MSIKSGFFNPEANTEERYIGDYDRLAEIVSHVKGLGLRIVLTMGTFDMAHIGHARYLREAKNRGDFLIVGVDEDEKVRMRKGPDRPIIPHTERLEMLSHLRYVDIVTIKRRGDEKWKLLKLVSPHTLIATKGTYDDAQLHAVKEYCGEVVVLDRLATTSTSALIRLVQIGGADKLVQKLNALMPETIRQAFHELREGK
jgi:D-glycero-beta-D-manno-heptose 1-phosphate adenylyltransferase